MHGSGSARRCNSSGRLDNGRRKARSSALNQIANIGGLKIFDRNVSRWLVLFAIFVSKVRCKSRERFHHDDEQYARGVDRRRRTPINSYSRAGKLIQQRTQQLEINRPVFAGELLDRGDGM